MRRTRLFDGECRTRTAARLMLGCLALAAATLPMKGCVVGGGPPASNDANDNAPANDNSGGSGNENSSNDNTAPRVRARLAVSNPTPGLNELVVLTCSLDANNPPAVDHYEFQGRTDRLTIDELGGTADFVVSDSDLNTSLQFSCRAILEGGEPSEVSAVATVIVGE